MIHRRHAIHAAALLSPVLLLPLLLRPELALAAAAAAICVLLAWKSVVYPVVLVGLVPVVVGALGSNPLPEGGVTYLFFGWTLLAIGFAVLREDVFPPSILFSVPVVCSLALGALVIAMLATSPAQEYGASKVQLFLAQNLVLLFAAIIIGRDRKHLELFLGLTLLVAFVSALVLIEQLIGGQAREVLPDRFAVNPEENPIFLGRSAAAGLIIAIYLLLAGTVRRYRLYAMALAPALAVALLASGSRGPLVALVCAIAVLLACMLGASAIRRRIPTLAIALVAGLALAATLVPGEAIDRTFAVLSQSGSGVDANGRTELWGTALESIGQHPLLGIGTGGFAAINQEVLFPHNLLLESAVEWGVLGLLFVGGMIGATFARLRRTWRRLPERLPGEVAVITALFVAAVVNAMLSGDITVNSSVWLIAGLALGLSARATGRAASPFGSA